MRLVSCKYLVHVRKTLHGFCKICNRFIGIAMFNSISDTVLDMPLQNNLSYFVKCRFRCIYLCKDVFARNIFINHTVNRLYLSDDFFRRR